MMSFNLGARIFPSAPSRGSHSHVAPLRWWEQHRCFQPCPLGSRWWGAILVLERRFVRVADRVAGKKVGEQMPKSLVPLLGKC